VFCILPFLPFHRSISLQCIHFLVILPASCWVGLHFCWVQSALGAPPATTSLPPGDFHLHVCSTRFWSRRPAIIHYDRLIRWNTHSTNFHFVLHSKLPFILDLTIPGLHISLESSISAFISFYTNFYILGTFYLPFSFMHFLFYFLVDGSRCSGPAQVTIPGCDFPLLHDAWVGRL